MKCFACGKEIDKTRFPSNITFCPYCGDKLCSEGRENFLQFCPYCGEKLAIQTNFCPNCGEKLVQGSGTLQKVNTESDIKRTINPVINVLNGTFWREREKKKLFKEWVKFSSLPTDRVPSTDEEFDPKINSPKQDD